MDAVSGRMRGVLGLLVFGVGSACDASSGATSGDVSANGDTAATRDASSSTQPPDQSAPTNSAQHCPVDPSAGSAPTGDDEPHNPVASGTTEELEPTLDPDAGSTPRDTSTSEPSAAETSDAMSPMDTIVPADSMAPAQPDLPMGSGSVPDASLPDDATAPSLSDYQPLGEPITLNGLDAASSDVTWRPESDTFFVITDGSRHLYEFDREFTSIVRTVTLSDGPTDGEGIAYLGNDLFAIASEDNTVVVFHLDPTTTTLVVSSELRGTYVPAAPPPRVNTGFEGIAFRPMEGGGGDLVVCQEGDPGNVPIAVYRFPFAPDGPAEGSYADGTLAVVQPFDAPLTLGAFDGDLTGMAYEGRDDTLLITSHLASRLLKVDAESGALLEQLELSASPQYEGVALASENRLALVSEPGFVELWQTP